MSCIFRIFVLHLSYEFITRLRKDIKVGDRIEVLSFPKSCGTVDSFKGFKGTVDFIEYDDRTRLGRGSIIIFGESSWLAGCGLKRLKYRKLSNNN